MQVLTRMQAWLGLGTLTLTKTLTPTSCQVLTRMQAQLIRLNEKVATLPPAAEGARPLVVMYGHSMCGAALAILTGNGKQVDGESYLYRLPKA